MKLGLLFASCFALTSVAAPVLADEPPAPGNGGVLVEPPPPPAPPPVDAPAKPAEPPKKKKVPVSVRVDGGYGLRSLEELSVKGGDVGVGIGAQPLPTFAIYGAVRGFFGSTELGLDVKALRVGCDLDVVFDRFRLGFDPGIFVVGIGRATRDQTIVAWGPKIGAIARVDVVRADLFALFLRASVDGGPTFSDGSLFGGVTLGAGVDFDVMPGDRESL